MSNVCIADSHAVSEKDAKLISKASQDIDIWEKFWI